MAVRWTRFFAVAGTLVPAGAREVVFVDRSRLLVAGAIASLLSLAIVALALLSRRGPVSP